MYFLLNSDLPTILASEETAIIIIIITWIGRQEKQGYFKRCFADNKSIPGQGLAAERRSLTTRLQAQLQNHTSHSRRIEAVFRLGIHTIIKRNTGGGSCFMFYTLKNHRSEEQIPFHHNKYSEESTRGQRKKNLVYSPAEQAIYIASSMKHWFNVDAWSHIFNILHVRIFALFVKRIFNGLL
jgi:DNA-binding helix-hairpin-helix protein with protein kinase domain